MHTHTDARTHTHSQRQLLLGCFCSDVKKHHFATLRLKSTPFWDLPFLPLHPLWIAKTAPDHRWRGGPFILREVHASTPVLSLTVIERRNWVLVFVVRHRVRVLSPPCCGQGCISDQWIIDKYLNISPSNLYPAATRVEDLEKCFKQDSADHISKHFVFTHAQKRPW